ncbi:Lrp/AsnC ligand binding domain-containing protein [Nonomuraea polychroma]|uniref:Lrp/AsnC ligand binding domain-containing protein n=1 Tax=Nonomuraea polychroma TaxID=46176 RepID=UPI003D89E11F
MPLGTPTEPIVPPGRATASARSSADWAPTHLRQRLLTTACVLSRVHVTGQNCYELTIAVRDARHLETVLEELGTLGETTSSVVLSELVNPRDVDVTTWVTR